MTRIITLVASLLLLVSSVAPLGAAEPVDINTAGQEQLTSLPQVGPAIALRIIEYRQQNGPFERTEELMNVRGIGAKTFAKLQQLITVGTPEPKPESQQAQAAGE